MRSVAGGILIGCKAVAVGNRTGVIGRVSAGHRGLDRIAAVRRIFGNWLAGIGTDKGDRIGAWLPPLKQNGRFCFTRSEVGGLEADFVDPFFEYWHGEALSITGGDCSFLMS